MNKAHIVLGVIITCFVGVSESAESNDLIDELREIRFSSPTDEQEFHPCGETLASIEIYRRSSGGSQNNLVSDPYFQEKNYEEEQEFFVPIKLEKINEQEIHPCGETLASIERYRRSSGGFRNSMVRDPHFQNYNRIDERGKKPRKKLRAYSEEIDNKVSESGGLSFWLKRLINFQKKNQQKDPK